MLSIHERLKIVRKELGLTQEQIGEICGIKKSAYSMIETGSSKLSRRNFEILTANLNINKEWLLNGEGEMFSESQVMYDNTSKKTKTSYNLVPVFDINIVKSTGANSTLDIIRYVPFCNARSEDIAVIVNDPSMCPMISINSILLLKRNKTFDIRFNNGKPHLIMFKDGRRYVRNLLQCTSDDNIIICKAANPEFDDIEIEKTNLTAIFKVMAIYYDSSY
ncbi:MAG: helix-turn-helix domain-containing protein [Rikenellaceae bacterium]